MSPVIVIEYQDQIGKWQRYTEIHNESEAYRTAKQRAKLTKKRHRLVDNSGRLLDIVEP
jgi:hypothetical protein